jgi:hypothetical protein
MEKEMAELVDSNGEPMFDDLEFFDTYVEKIPIGMKRKYVFNEVPYWEHLNIGHLLDPMHILKKFHLIYGGKYHGIKETNWMSGEILFPKKRHWPINETRGEVGPSWYFKEGDVPWILNKYDLSMAKDVILVVKAPSLYGLNL